MKKPIQSEGPLKLLPSLKDFVFKKNAEESPYLIRVTYRTDSKVTFLVTKYNPDGDAVCTKEVTVYPSGEGFDFEEYWKYVVKNFSTYNNVLDFGICL